MSKRYNARPGRGQRQTKKRNVVRVHTYNGKTVTPGSRAKPRVRFGRSVTQVWVASDGSKHRRRRDALRQPGMLLPRLQITAIE